MKIAPECIPCLLSRLLYETDLADSSRAGIVMKEACGILNAGLSSNICSAELATRVHGKTYEILGDKDPYKTVKKEAMSVGLELQKKAELLINNSTDKIRTAILCAIVGNVLDFGIEGSVNSPEELVTRFEGIYNEGLGHDDVDTFKRYLKKNAKILYFVDNCGEIVFDKLLCKELKRFDVYISAVVKGEPILSDATLEEAKQISLNETVDEIITTGDFAVGVNIKNLALDLKNRLEMADVIISKGMANFEALSETEYKPIMYLLRTKCNPVAAALELSKNLNVAKLIEPL